MEDERLSEVKANSLKSNTRVIAIGSVCWEIVFKPDVFTVWVSDDPFSAEYEKLIQ